MMKFIIAIFAICIAQIAIAEKCNEACPRNYRPLCAVDNTGNFKTFANKCIFEAEQCNNRGAGWKVLTPTVCPPASPLKTLNKCNEVCPRIYNPVCGVDNFGNRKTFSNNCVFEAEDCNNRGAGWKILSSNACDETIVEDSVCNEVCPRMYAPVCGIDNFGSRKTFANKCVFDAEDCNNRGAGWKILSSNECDEAIVEDSVCNEVCPRIYAPVCGVDNFGSRKTFANKCVFDAEDCNNRGAGWRVQENSECEEVAVNDELCPVICPALLNPLCGIDNTGRQRTFSNKCLFESESCSNRGAGWRILDNEECKPLAMKLMTPTCTRACTDDLNPVWAMDNTGNKRQFDNLCGFNNVQCENRGAGWRLITE